MYVSLFEISNNLITSLMKSWIVSLRLLEEHDTFRYSINNVTLFMTFQEFRK